MTEGVQKSLMNNWWLCVTVLQNSVELLHWIRGRGGCEHSLCVYCTLCWYLGQCVTPCVSDKDGVLQASYATQHNTTQSIPCEGSASPSHFLSSRRISKMISDPAESEWLHHAVLSDCFRSRPSHSEAECKRALTLLWPAEGAKTSSSPLLIHPQGMKYVNPDNPNHTRALDAVSSGNQGQTSGWLARL